MYVVHSSSKCVLNFYLLRKKILTLKTKYLHSTTFSLLGAGCNPDMVEESISLEDVKGISVRSVTAERKIEQRTGSAIDLLYCFVTYFSVEGWKAVVSSFRPNSHSYCRL